MMKQRSLGFHFHNLDDHSEPHLHDAFRTHAMNQIHEDALEFGIIIKYLGV